MKHIAHSHFTLIANDPERLKKVYEQMEYEKWLQNYKPVDKNTVLEVLKNANSKANKGVQGL